MGGPTELYPQRVGTATCAGAFPADICAFAREFTSSSEKPIHLRLIIAPRHFLEECSFLLP